MEMNIDPLSDIRSRVGRSRRSMKESHLAWEKASPARVKSSELVSALLRVLCGGSM